MQIVGRPEVFKPILLSDHNHDLFNRLHAVQNFKIKISEFRGSLRTVRQYIINLKTIHSICKYIGYMWFRQNYRSNLLRPHILGIF